MKHKYGIALDYETTGLLAPRASDIIHQPFATELYMCKFNNDFEIVEEIDTLINIPIPVPEHITKITGINDEMLRGKPTHAEINDQIIDICSDADLVLGQNLMFDLEMLRYSFIRAGMLNELPTFKEKVCTIEMSYPMYNRRMKLGEIYEHATGKKIVDAHRAGNDVKATIVCYKWLLSEGF